MKGVLSFFLGLSKSGLETVSVKSRLFSFSFRWDEEVAFDSF